ncbi:MAG: hypothetical protein PUP90_32280 [Nostoc sp. S4]|nr:hypothetical protein [Nostoc sp. S4]
MNWKLDEAQEKLLEVIDAITSEPQLIFKQDKLYQFKKSLQQIQNL